MSAKLGRAFGHTTRGEIGRAPANHMAHSTDPGGDKAAVGQWADPNGEIDMLFQKIDCPICEHQPDIDVAIGLEECCDYRQHMQAAEDDRCGDDQVSLRRALLACGGSLGFVDLLENALAGLHV